jgi:hypothetical protein
VYDTARGQDLRFAIPASSVFGDGNLTLVRGRTEMSYSDLRKAEILTFLNGYSPHAEIMQRHQMLSFPVACLVFAVIGLALGLHTRKEGKLGGFALGIGVISAYYGLMTVFENMVKGNDFPAEWARWMPNIILGLVGIAAVRWRTRFAGHELSVPVPRWLRWKPSTDAAGQPTARVVLVIRIPEFRLPRPRLLDLYVGRRYLNVAGLSFFGLLAFYYIATFIDKSERLFKGQANPWMLAQYFLYSTPQFVAVVPMAILVAVLATVGGLTLRDSWSCARAESAPSSAVPFRARARLSGGAFHSNTDPRAPIARPKPSRRDQRCRHGSPTPWPANWRVDKDRI